MYVFICINFCGCIFLSIYTFIHISIYICIYIYINIFYVCIYMYVYITYKIFKGSYMHQSTDIREPYMCTCTHGQTQPISHKTPMLAGYGRHRKCCYAHAAVFCLFGLFQDANTTPLLLGSFAKGQLPDKEGRCCKRNCTWHWKRCLARCRVLLFFLDPPRSRSKPRRSSVMHSSTPLPP